MRLAALVLAAGAGSRFGGAKLAASFRGEAVVEHALRAARAAPVEQVLVVAAPGLAIALTSPTVCVLRMASDALSASLKAGVAALGRVDGAFVFLGDMPLVPPGIAGELARQLPGHYAARPRCKGRPGHPVLLGADALADVPALCGDQGAGQLLKGRRDIAWRDTEDEGVLLDIDRTEDIARLEGSWPR